MPPTASPGNREKIEDALGPVLRSALSALCSVLGVPREEWQSVPPLEQLFTTAAVVRLAGELANGSTTGSVEQASRRLGVRPATILKRLYRWE